MENKESIFDKLAKIIEEQTVSDITESISSVVAETMTSVTPAFGSFAVFGSKVLTKWALAKVCHELKERKPTKEQCNKMNVFTIAAINTFIKLCQKTEGELDGSHTYVEDIYWEHNAYEIAENIYLKAANESQRKKLEIFGAFFGHEMFYSNHDWQEVYFLTNLISELSFRQIIMIKLLVENVPSRAESREKRNRFIDFNHESTYMEFQGLLYRGLFEVGEGSVGWASYNFSDFDFNSDIYTTDLANVIYERLMLSEVNSIDVEEMKESF